MTTEGDTRVSLLYVIETNVYADLILMIEEHIEIKMYMRTCVCALAHPHTLHTLDVIHDVAIVLIISIIIIRQCFF